MAELTPNATQPPDSIGGTNCKSSLKRNTGTSPPNPHKQLIFVRYLDHVLYSRNTAIAMKPQTREAVGWLVYDCELYVILSWDWTPYTSWRRPQSFRVGASEKRYFGYTTTKGQFAASTKKSRIEFKKQTTYTRV
jgi:hypothetical protein